MDPYTWIYLIVLLVSIAVSIAFAPKTQQAKPPQVDEFQAPVIDEGADIQWLHGECWVSGPNVGYWGNLRTEPIKTKSGK